MGDRGVPGRGLFLPKDWVAYRMGQGFPLTGKRAGTPFPEPKVEPKIFSSVIAVTGQIKSLSNEILAFGNLLCVTEQ